jgi:cytochrome c-type biogenesis protein CcmH/NrfG
MLLPALRLLACGLAVAALRAASPVDDALALSAAKRYPEAQAALEKIVAGDPQNAAACHALGMVLRKRADREAFEQAVNWLAKAAELEPNNAAYLADYGGTSMELAGRIRSDSLTRAIGFATKGRDAMEKSLSLAPENIEARIGLFQFYSQAPWPIGSGSKAKTQLEEIRKRQPATALILELPAMVAAKDYAGAFKACDSLLAKDPANYSALYQYGRIASVSGQNLERGLAALQQCLAMEPPGPTAPRRTNVWNRIGAIQEKLQHPTEARAAYEAALKEDPGNRQASDALANLK